MLEYLYTENQGGSLFIDNSEAQRGRDNYFNHSQYQDGWSRYGMTLGTPFITPSDYSRSELPRYGFTNNNRVAVMHVGLSGHAFHFVNFQIKASYSENLGTYEVPFPEPVHQFSGLLNLSTQVPVLNGLAINTALATDIGGLYPTGVGYYVGICKNGQIWKKTVY